ncbi:MAG: hypothetical protein ACFFEV_10470, partial [Candidatus Thorarchaeota archaeon]
STYGAYTVNLFNGSMYPLNEPGDIIHMTTMNINQSSTGPDLSDYSPSITTMYYASQYFVPTYGTEDDIHIVASYNHNNQAGMVAFEYGAGTVFLSSPHPEYEEDSTRDDTTFGDDLEDPDTEWDLLLRVSKWLVDASPNTSLFTTTSITSTTSTTTTTITTTNGTETGILEFPLIVAVSTSTVFVLLIVVIQYRRIRV